MAFWAPASGEAEWGLQATDLFLLQPHPAWPHHGRQRCPHELTEIRVLLSWRLVSCYSGRWQVTIDLFGWPRSRCSQHGQDSPVGLAQVSSHTGVSSSLVQAPQDLGPGTEGSHCICSYDQWSLLHIFSTWWSYCYRVRVSSLNRTQWFLLGSFCSFSRKEASRISLPL